MILQDNYEFYLTILIALAAVIAYPVVYFIVSWGEGQGKREGGGEEGRGGGSREGRGREERGGMGGGKREGG